MCHEILHFPNDDGDEASSNTGVSSGSRERPSLGAILGFAITILAVIPVATTIFFFITCVHSEIKGSWSPDDGKSFLTGMFGGLIVFVLTALFAFGIRRELVDRDSRPRS
jgi:hypothetical protein